MVQDLSITVLLTLGGWCIYMRRATWGCRLRRVLTLSVVFIVAGTVLTAPSLNPYVGPPLAGSSGIRHFDDFLGHLCFLSAACAIIYALIYRLVPSRTARRLMLKRVEIPTTASAALMLAMITLNHQEELPTGAEYPDFFDVRCGLYLGVYWTVYASVLAYLGGYMIRLLWALRRDPRSRRTAHIYLVASALGMLAIAAMYGNVWVKFMDTWVWLLITASCDVATVAAALSWLRTGRSAIHDVPTPPGGNRTPS